MLVALFLTPSVQVWTLLYFDSENLWFQVSCVKNGARIPDEQEVTVTVTITLWLKLPLVPVTFTR